MSKNEVRFKSNSSVYYKEKYGHKPNTVRKLDTTDDRYDLLNTSKAMRIRITLAEDPKTYFIREITDITYWEGLWIISWKHEEVNL